MYQPASAKSASPRQPHYGDDGGFIRASPSHDGSFDTLSVLDVIGDGDDDYNTYNDSDDNDTLPTQRTFHTSTSNDKTLLMPTMIRLPSEALLSSPLRQKRSPVAVHDFVDACAMNQSKDNLGCCEWNADVGPLSEPPFWDQRQLSEERICDALDNEHEYDLHHKDYQHRPVATIHFHAERHEDDPLDIRSESCDDSIDDSHSDSSCRPQLVRRDPVIRLWPQSDYSQVDGSFATMPQTCPPPVHFSTVTVREMPTTLGVEEVKEGPALTFDWMPLAQWTTTIDDYESNYHSQTHCEHDADRLQEESACAHGSREGDDGDKGIGNSCVRLTAQQRYDILIDQGIPDDLIKMGMVQSQVLRNQRTQTNLLDAIQGSDRSMPSCFASTTQLNCDMART